MKRIGIALMALLLVSGQAFAQSDSPTPRPNGAGSGEEPGGMGSSAWTGGAGGSFIGTNNDGSSSKYYQPPVATGVDLKGPAKTEPPFAE
jgi:hypothetical protein